MQAMELTRKLKLVEFYKLSDFFVVSGMKVFTQYSETDRKVNIQCSAQ